MSAWVEQAGNGEQHAGQPDDRDHDPGAALGHPRPQRVHDGNVPSTPSKTYISAWTWTKLARWHLARRVLLLTINCAFIRQYCVLNLPIAWDCHEREDAGGDGDAWYEVVDVAVEWSERPVAAGSKSPLVFVVRVWGCGGGIPVEHVREVEDAVEQRQGEVSEA